jgi:FixJ family two-component response regulator
MARHATPITLAPGERAELARRVRARTSRQQEAQRAHIVLRAAAGAANQAIAAELGLSRRTAQHWRDRFAAERLAGLADRPVLAG